MSYSEPNELLKSAEEGKKRAGQSDLIKYLKGTHITRSASIKAKCYDCNGMGELPECSLEGCPLYPYSPYNKR